jgi:hypothetical protein
MYYVQNKGIKAVQKALGGIWRYPKGRTFRRAVLYPGVYLTQYEWYNGTWKLSFRKTDDSCVDKELEFSIGQASPELVSWFYRWSTMTDGEIPDPPVHVGIGVMGDTFSYAVTLESREEYNRKNPDRKIRPWGGEFVLPVRGSSTND